jgi:carbonic anhydrase
MNSVEITYRYASEGGVSRTRPADADAAQRRLNEGCRAFAELFTCLDSDAGVMRRVVPIDPRDLGLLHRDMTDLEQHPFAAVLGCSDARVPIELIFNEGPNDLFIVRVAGNILGEDVLGSLKFALDHLSESLKLIVVLGHSACGAVTAAVDVFLDPAGYLSLASKYTVRSVVDRIHVVVHACAQRMEATFGQEIKSHPRYREALIETAVVTNAALAAHTLQREITAIGESDVRVVYGVYLLTERSVWAPRCGSTEVSGLDSPPTSAEDFTEFSNALLSSSRISSLLAK